MKKDIDGVKVEKIRIANDKTKANMASIMGCSERSYYDKVVNKKPFKVSEVIALMEYFNVKFEDLL